jgi:hypothetical protein
VLGDVLEEVVFGLGLDFVSAGEPQVAAADALHGRHPFLSSAEVVVEIVSCCRFR